MPFGKRWRVSSLATVLAAALLTTLFTVSPARSEILTVVLDQAKLVKLPDHTATLVIGNPLIVDAALQPGGNMVLTAKGFGSTNVMALDRGGNVLMEKSVQVQVPQSAVVVYRGIERQTYSCTPICQHQVALGDSAAAFTATLSQTVTRNTQVLGASR